MSCWVAPTLAAELWQIPLDQLLRRIRDGEIPCKVQDGFTFVQVSPDGTHMQRPCLPREQRPPTFTAAAYTSAASTHTALAEQESVVELESAAELEPVSEQELAVLADALVGDALNEAVEDDMGPEDRTGSATLGDWRAGRRKAGRTRVPPRRVVSCN